MPFSPYKSVTKPENGKLFFYSSCIADFVEPVADGDSAITLLVLKLTLTPLLIALATLAARRWGPIIGGWIVGLPLTSGPVSVFLALEQGREFADTAAHSALLGVIAVLVFCVSYPYFARKFNCLITVAITLVLYFLAVSVLASVSLPLIITTPLVAILIAVALRVVGPVKTDLPVMSPPSWDLPVRMLAATTIVLLVTTLSTLLGPQLSGVLSAFPVFICVMSVFSHHFFGAAITQQMARGVIAGSFAFEAFFLVVSLTVLNGNLFVVYLLAVIAAACVNLMVLRFFIRK
jgi:hypothetical protein